MNANPESSCPPAARSSTAKQRGGSGGSGETAGWRTGAEGARWERTNLSSSHAMSSNVRRDAYAAIVRRAEEEEEGRAAAVASASSPLDDGVAHSCAFVSVSVFARWWWSSRYSAASRTQTHRIKGTDHGDVAGCWEATSEARSRGACASSHSNSPRSTASYTRHSGMTVPAFPGSPRSSHVSTPAGPL